MKILCVFIIFMTLMSEPILAKRMSFGENDIHRVIDGYSFISNSGVKLVLGYRVTRKKFIANYGLVDAGYILIPYTSKGSLSNSFYALEKELLNNLQNKSLLPDPLPEYKITLLDYIAGHLLWLMLLLLIFAVTFYQLIKKPTEPLVVKRKRINKESQKAEARPQTPQWTLTKKPTKDYKVADRHRDK